MAQMTYWIQGLSDPNSLLRIQHELLLLRDVEAVAWMSDAVLWIKTSGSSDPLAYIASLCRREEPDATVTRMPAAGRFLSLYLWMGSLLLWLVGQLTPLPLWGETLFFALSAAMALTPTLFGGLSLWEKQAWGTPVLPLVWLVLSFLSVHAAQGALTCLLYSIGSFLFSWRARQLCRTAPPVSDDGKSGIMRRANRVSRVYTLIVVILAVVAGLLIPAIANQPALDWLYRGLTLLVLASSGVWPLTVWLHLLDGQRAADRQGAALRHPRYVETLAQAQSIALDRQGTLIEEPLYVTALHTLPDVSADMCVGLAALLEAHTDHPVAQAIVAHASHLSVEQTGHIALEDVTVIPAMGITARMAEHRVLCGNPHLLERYDLVAENLPESTVYLAIDDRVVAAFDIAGSLRPDATEAVRELRGQGLKPIALLTGDQPTSAEKAAVQVGIDKVYASLLPESKLSVFREIQRKHAPALFIGSGVYDVPTMVQADVGVALSCSPPEARDAADVLLTTDELAALPRAIAVCRTAMIRLQWKGRIDLAVRLLALIGGIAGVLPMWGAALTQILLSVGTTLDLRDKKRK